MAYSAMSKYQITQATRDRVLQLHEKGLKRSQINKELQKTLGWDRRRVGAAINQILSDSASETAAELVRSTLREDSFLNKIIPTKHVSELEAQEISERILSKGLNTGLVSDEIAKRLDLITPKSTLNREDLLKLHQVDYRAILEAKKKEDADLAATQEQTLLEEQAKSAIGDFLSIVKDHVVCDEVQEFGEFTDLKKQSELVAINDSHGSKVVMKDGKVVLKTSPSKAKEEIEDCGAHTFNHATQQYIWQLKDSTKVVLSAAQWKAILREYKAGNTIPQIALKHHVLTSKLTEILKKEGITHDTFPATSQELASKDLSTLTEEERKFKFAQDIEKESWKATQADADKWRRFEYGTLEPFQEFLSTWEPKAYAPKVSPAVKSTNDDVFVIGLSDLHFGAFTSEATTFSGKSYSTKKAVDSVALYLTKIKQKLAQYKQAPSKAVVLLMGDILHTHTNNGMTTKGTQLKYDVTGPEQLEIAFNSLYTFINNIIGMFSEVHVHSVRGNHSGNGDYALALVLKSVFTVCSTVQFHNHKADHALVELGRNTLAILTHGASDEVKAILPASDAARQNWAMNLFTQYDGNLSKKKQLLLLSADQHHIEVKEYASFTHYMFPTAVDGDHYSESKGLNSKAAQLCLIVGDEGVVNHIPVYL